MAVINTIGDLVKGNVQAWLGIEAGSKHAKLARTTAAGSAEASDDRKRVGADNPFIDAQSAFLNNMLQDTFSTSGGHLGKKFEDPETVQAQHTQQLVAQAETQRGYGATLEQVLKEIAEIQAARLAAEARLTEAEDQLRRSASAAGSTTTRATILADVADPCLYLVANIGWDTPEGDLRTPSCQGGIDPRPHRARPLPSRRRQHQPRQGRQQRRGPLQVAHDGQALPHSGCAGTTSSTLQADRCGRTSAKGDELRSERGKLTGSELLEEYESDGKQLRMAVAKRIPSLTVLVGGQRAAYFGDGELSFTLWARERYMDDERATALGFSAH